MLSPRKLFAIGLLAAALGFSASQVGAQQYIYGTAALVNGAEISNQRLEQHLDEYLKSKRRNITTMINPNVYKKYKREALDQLIEREVLWQAARAADVKVADEEVKAAVKAAAAQFKTADGFKRKLDAMGMDERGYAEYVRREIAGARYLLDVSQDEPVISEADIQTVYEQNKSETFTRPEMVRARHILLRAETARTPEQRAEIRKKIEDLLAQVRAGADFAELARLHSDDRTAEEGGDLGEFPRGRMVKPFEDAAFAMQPGEISGVVESRFGFHIIKLEGRSPAKVMTLEEAREPIRMRLSAERRTEIARQHTQELIRKAKVQVLIRLTSQD
jgi:peptidyl-prolyl cis-trans isomerase C